MEVVFTAFCAYYNSSVFATATSVITPIYPEPTSSSSFKA